MEDHRGAGELWEQLVCLFPNKREQRLIYLTYNCGLKPREILRLCPQEFSTIEEIHRLRSSVIERLLCNADRLSGRQETSNEDYRNV